jgi:hypothetical protein
MRMTTTRRRPASRRDSVARRVLVREGVVIERLTMGTEVDAVKRL